MKNDLDLAKELSKLWREGWRLASPYVSRAYGGFIAVGLLGYGVGTLIASFCHQVAKWASDPKSSSTSP